MQNQAWHTLVCLERCRFDVQDFMTTQPSFTPQPSRIRVFAGMLLAWVTLTQSAPVAAQLPPPNLTHVNNVNAAGNATLHWDVFSPLGDEEFLQNEIKVFDLQTNPLGNQWHIITLKSSTATWFCPPAG